MTTHATALVALLGLAAASPAQVTIERIAPENSVVIAGAASAGQTLERIRQTSLWTLWRSRTVQDQVAETLKEMEDELAEALHELGVEEEEGEERGVPKPQGPMGLAIFPGNAGGAGDAGGAEARVGFLVMADYGTAAPRMGRIVDALLEQARKDGLDVREIEMLGRTVHTFDFAGPPPMGGMDEDDFDAGWEDEDDFGMMPDAEDFLDSLGQVHCCRDGARFFLCSDAGALRDALERIDEDGRSGLESRQDFQATMKQLGAADGYAMLLTRDLWGGLIPADDPMMMMMQGMIKSIVGDIRGLGLGVRVGTGEVMMENTFAVYMPSGKSGLTGLLDVETPQGTLPPFVGPQAVVYGRGNFRFGGVTAFLRSVAMTNPMIGAEINRMLAEHGPMIERLCGALGPRVHTISTLARPIRLDSVRELYAIECTKPADVEAVLAQNAAKWGLTSRDFMGSRIYSRDFGNGAMMFGGPLGGEDISIGVGGGHMFVGAGKVVEDALRAGSRKGGATLAEDPEFKRVQRALKAPKNVAWGMLNLGSYLEYMKEMPDLFMKQAVAGNPDLAGMMADEGPAWDGFDVKAIAKYLGPVCWEVRSQPDGFAGRYLLLAPAAAPAEAANAGR